MRRFDRKFGADLVRELPESPAVYLFRDADGRVLYAGKARNIRRRLAGYRRAGRRKAERKMRTLVRVAHSLEVRIQPSERQALLLENELIRSLRPRYNVEGAFAFLYPAIGTGLHRGGLLLCLSSRPEAFAHLGLRWHGCFRPRHRARLGFDALVELLSRLGHREPRSRLPRAPRLRGSRLVALRRLGREWLEPLDAFLGGEGDSFAAELAERLVESPQARREAAAVGAWLRALDEFYRRDARALRRALEATGRGPGFVPRDERDALFIRARAAAARPGGARP